MRQSGIDCIDTGFTLDQGQAEAGGGGGNESAGFVAVEGILL